MFEENKRNTANLLLIIVLCHVKREYRPLSATLHLVNLVAKGNKPTTMVKYVRCKVAPGDKAVVSDLSDVMLRELD